MSGKITDRVLEEIRARIDIVELIGARIPLKKTGGTFKGCCPFHHEKTPSFHVNPVKQFYHCFGCGESGDIFSFLMKQDGLTFTDAARSLAERVGVVIEEAFDEQRQTRSLLYALHAELAAFYQRCLKQTHEAEPARRYLAERRLSGDVADLFGIGYAPRAPRDVLIQWGRKYNYSPDQLVAAGILAPSNRADRPDHYYDRFRGRLMFPITDRQGRVVAFSARVLDTQSHPAKYVNSPETEIFSKSKILYALDKAAPKIVKHPRREAIICEGQIDVIRCHASGFETAVASQGTAFTKDHVSLLKRYADSVVLVFDGDNAGRKAALRTGALFLEEEIPVRVATLPSGEDPDSILRDKGAPVFREILEQSHSITAFQIETLRLQETDSDSIDAVSRMARAVLDMLAACPSAVLRSHLLQDAASLLHLPIRALEDDLQKHREELAHRTTYTEPFRTAPPDQERPPFSPEVAEPESYPDDTEGIAQDDEGRLPSAPAPEPLPRTEYVLCEFLIEHEHDAVVMDLVARHLPSDILFHPLAKMLVDELLIQHRTGEDRLAHLYQTVDPQWHPTFDRLLAHKQKMLSAKELTKDEAVRDLITAVWVIRFKTERGRLSVLSSPENDSRRLQLSCLIKNLETLPWEKACRLMSATGAQIVTPEGSPSVHLPASQADAGAESFGHATDNASSAFDPEEFLPSEYPPDEMPD